MRDLRKSRAVSIPKGKLTTDWKSVVEDERNHHRGAGGRGDLGASNGSQSPQSGQVGRHSEQALLSEHGEELFELARKHRNLY